MRYWIDRILEKKLKGLKKDVILVVMADEMISRGGLVAFDRSTLILSPLRMSRDLVSSIGHR